MRFLLALLSLCLLVALPVAIANQTTGDIECTTPAFDRPQEVTLIASDGNFSLSHLEPTIAVSPDRPTDVFVKGANFSSNLTCHFDDQPSTMAMFISSSEVLCRLPKHIMPGVYKVRVSNGGALDETPFLLLEVILPPSIADLSPSVGQAGSNVTITGKSFHPRMECAFGSEVVETFFLNSTLVQCTAPTTALSKASVPVGFTLDYRPIYLDQPFLFTFVDLSLVSVSPTFGDVTGGTRVTFKLKEENATSMISHCLFGDVVIPATSEQTGTVVCITPSAREGPVRVGVSIDGNDFSRSQLTYEYTHAAVFSAIHPNSGPESGGTLVVFAGSGFVKSNMIKCFLGRVESPGRWVSEEELGCETPPLQPGTYEVTVSLNGVDALATNQSFEVYPRMTALYALPSFGATSGSTSILVHGTNFRQEDTPACRFEGNSSVVVDASYVESNLLECTTPKWDVAESVHLEVTSNAGETTVAASGFTFYTPFDISSIHPSHGFVRGGTNVTVNGDHFSDALGPVQCRFNDAVVVAEVVSANQILCTAPPALASGGVVFSVSYGEDVFILPLQAFEYDGEVVLDELYPLVVPSTADKTVTVYGSSFKNRDELGCRILSNHRDVRVLETHATFVSETQIQCRVPKGLRPGAYSVSITSNGQDFSESSLDFSVIDPLLAKSIHPKMGSPDTVHMISLEGVNFQDLDGLACLVDENFIVPSRFVNATSIQCSLPVNLDVGAVSVELALDGVPISTGPPLSFTFIDLALGSIWPTFGEVHGGTRVTFHLKEESPSVVSHCTFGEDVVPARIYQSELICVSPRAQREGPVRVGVSVDGNYFATSHVAFDYTKPAVFDGMHPRSGPETGGTVVKLSGANFVHSNGIKCAFGGTEAPGRWLSEDTLSCTAPAMRPGNYKLRISLNGVDTLRIPWQFSSFKEIDVLYASPSSGSLLGGTEISLVGKSFVATDEMACRFGNLGSSPAAFVSSTEVTCIAPDVSKEADSLVGVGVQVSLNGVDFSAAAARFHFTPPAVVHSIFPAHGSVNGGTDVHVFGSNMFPSVTSDTASCTFGSFTVPALMLSNEELTCVSPPHLVDEPVFFAVSLNGVDLVHQGRAATFLYTPNVQTLSIHPNGGPFTGGTLVTVTGESFGGQTSSLRCKFGASYSDALYISDKTIQCKAPMHPPGTVDFVVVSESDDAVPSDAVFEFYQPPVILFNNPASGPHYGGTVVRIYGQGFRSNVDYTCSFGDSASVPGKFVATDAIECLSPRIPIEDAQTSVELVVAEKQTNFTANALHFSYVPPPSLEHLSPQYVFPEGGDVLSVFGSHLNTTETAWCRFLLPSKTDGSLYYETVQASAVSDDEHVDCAVPQYPLVTSQADAFVEVSTNGWDWSTTRLLFTYAQKPTMESVRPSLGSVNGGTAVTIRGSHFLQESRLWCAFGFARSVPAKWLSSTEVTCTSPPASHPANVTLSLQFEESQGVLNGAHHFAYHRELSLGVASPLRGFVSGGTVVTVEGTGFLDVPTLSCRFGQSAAVSATLLSPMCANGGRPDCRTPVCEQLDRQINVLTCSSPPVNHAQGVELEVSLNGADWVGLPLLGSSTEEKMFTYDAEVGLFRTVPSIVPITTEDSDAAEKRTITLLGTSFVNTTSLSCVFGQHLTTLAEYIDESEVRCILPTVTEVGEVDVRLSLNGVDISSKKTSVSFVQPALILGVSPNTIQEGSEVDLLIQGENFLQSSDLQCHFGGSGEHWSPARWVSSSSLRCTTPPLNLTYDGLEYVGVSNNGGHDVADLWIHPGRQLGQQLYALGVTSRAQFISMDPVVGYIAGGTKVTITLGNVKYMPALTCLFGTEGVPATLRTANSIICKSPPYQPGKITIKLASEGAHYIAGGNFEYVAPPILELLEPGTGPLEGGTAVTIKGSGLTGATHCRFSIGDDSHIVPAFVDDDSTLKCDAPPADEEAGALVEVSHNGHDFVGVGRSFRYRARPRLLAVEPSFGSDLGGKPIHIVGENFRDTPAQCRFGGTHLVNAIYISPTSLICIAPPLTIEPVPLSVAMDGLESTSIEELVYTPIKLPQIESIYPTFGAVNGNTTVVLHTTALHEELKLECLFGDHTVPALYLTTNSASCVAPRVDGPGVLNVSIAVDGERYLADGQNTIEFEYVPEPQVTSVYPNFGWTTGGDVISLSAKDLAPWLDNEVSCGFGGSNNFTKALQVGDRLVTCTLPPFREGSMQLHAPILLKAGEGLNALYVKAPAFSYLEPAVVTSVDPSVGSIRGGSIVRVSGSDLSNTFGLQCLFGSQAVDADLVGNGEIACVAPSWRGGPKIVEVHIGLQSGEKLSLASHATFTYLPHPAIESIQPRFGTIDGGTNVTLALGNAHSWTETAHHLSCRFGNSTLVPVISAKDGEVVCVSPPVNEAALASASERATPVPVSIYHGQLWLAMADDSFTYADHIEVDALNPSSGPLTGGTEVTLSARGLHHLPIDKITCHFGHEFVSATYMKDEDVLRCVSPPLDSTSSAKAVLLGSSGRCLPGGDCYEVVAGKRASLKISKAEFATRSSQTILHKVY